MAGLAVERILQRLHGVKKIATGWTARCPAHDDHVASLQISERDDLSVGLHCHAGCNKAALLDALGMQFSDLYAPEADDGKTIIATYDYKSLDGQLLYQAVRFFPKEFRQRRPDGQGGFTWNMGPLKGKHVPYRLPELKGQNLVVVVEGEKDADRLWKLGIPATTNIGGGKKWTQSDTTWLVKAGVTRVVILPDNDQTGEEHATVVGASLKKSNVAVSVVELPDLPDHGDVSDWLMNGGSKDQLVGFLSQPYVLPPAAQPTPVPAPSEPIETVPGLDVTDYHLTDLGAAESLRDRFGDRLRYDHQREMWVIWDGHYWKPDLDEEAFRIANEHIRKLQADSVLVPDFLKRKAYLEWALGREKRGPVVAMMAQAAALKPIAISGESWDSNGWALGCKNGVVNLKTGELRPGERDDFITLQVGPPYEHAECPRWMTFLDEVFDGDASLIDYIWRAVGYSLTTDMREQCFFVLFGSGSNGKSIFIDTLEKVLGSYGHRADMRMFAGFTDDMDGFKAADFRGKRMVYAAEVRPNSRMNEHVLKHFTGGESLRGEWKYGRSFTLWPVGKIWLGVNHRPRVADDSYGFWRRVRMIPFLRTFTGSVEDRGLRQTLLAEASGILQWAVDGCLQWQQRGLEAPAVVQNATNEYQEGEDPLAEFFEARLKVDEETLANIVAFGRVWQAYQEWAKDHGMSDRQMLSSKHLANSMQNRGFERVKQNNVVCYKGFELKRSVLY